MGPSCSFDFGDCGWNQSSGDIFNWQKFQGSTTTVGTGPVADHTLGTQFGINTNKQKSSKLKHISFKHYFFT